MIYQKRAAQGRLCHEIDGSDDTGRIFHGEALAYQDLVLWGERGRA
jgi:hypothetical protein